MPLHNPDTANSRVTRCPECMTTFRVTDIQLQAANGMVRCGSCMHVFHADQYWCAAEESAVSDTPTQGLTLLQNEAAIDSGWETTPPAAAAEGSGSPLPDPADNFDFSDSFLALNESSEQQTPFEVPADEHPDSAESNEDWARQLLEQEESDAPEPRKEILQAIMSSSREEGPQEGHGETDTSRRQASATAGDDNVGGVEFQGTEKWVQQIAEPDAHDDAPTYSAADQTPKSIQKTFQTTPEPTEEYIPEIFRKQSAPPSAPLEKQSTAVVPRRQNWRRRGQWAAGIAAAALVLLGQYCWFNAGKLAANPDLRPALWYYCQITGCTMPVFQDMALLNNSNLVVFKHPSVKGALLLDTILTNHASFEQAYPRLKVEFSNFQDRTVATRVFLPAEYLGGGVDPNSTMPIRQPVHLSLELADPGEQAVNYKIQLLPRDG